MNPFQINPNFHASSACKLNPSIIVRKAIITLTPHLPMSLCHLCLFIYTVSFSFLHSFLYILLSGAYLASSLSLSLSLNFAWMDPSNTQSQAMSNQSLEDALVSTKAQQDRKLRPQPEQALKCPRCDSINTKFCYYNNYSLSQPRYFCKACRRYWTKGGSLRNVPVGGGCRKNKRSSSSKRTQDQALTAATNSNQIFPTLPSITYDSNDLSLAFARLHKQQPRQLGMDDHDTSLLGNTNIMHPDILGHNNASTAPGFLDTLRGGFLDASNAFTNFYCGFGNGSIEEMESGIGVGVGEVVFPFEDMRCATTTPATATTTTVVKQEPCKGRDAESRLSWGMQWQLGGDSNVVAADSGRDYWSGVGSSWHGLMYSPLV